MNLDNTYTKQMVLESSGEVIDEKYDEYDMDDQTIEISMMGKLYICFRNE